MIALLTLLACGSPPPPWDLPPDLPAVEMPPITPFTGENRLPRLALGTPIDVGGEMAVTTGFGVWFADGDEVATPGWARVAMSPRPDVVWVADNAGGLAVIVGRQLTSHPLGIPIGIAPAGDGAVATMADGAVLLLKAKADGSPEVIDRVEVDGWPSDIAADGDRWAVALQGGGLVTGTHNGGLRADPPRGEYATQVGFHDGQLTVGDATGQIVVGDRAVKLGNATRGIDGPFRAMGPGGVYHLDDVIRQRPAAAHAVTVRTDGVWVSWSDGVVEHLSVDGEVLRTWEVGSGGLVSRTTSAGILVRNKDGTSSLMSPNGELLGTAPTGLLTAAGNGEIVYGAAEQQGLWMLDEEGVFAHHSKGNIRDVAFDEDGVAWVADANKGTVRLDSGPLSENGWRADNLALGPGGPATLDWLRGVVHLGADVTVKTPGNGPGILLHRGLLIVGMWGGSVAWSPVDDPTRWRAIDFPQPAHEREIRVCASGSSVYVTLSDLGVARLRIESDTLVLVDLHDTPGSARDCRVDGDDVWVADTSGLVRIAPLR